MHILLLNETDWFLKGPGAQHHLFERIAKNNKITVTVFDYDIDKIQYSKSRLVKKTIWKNLSRTVSNSNIKVIRSSNIRVPYVSRISSLIMNFFDIGTYIRKNRPSVIVNLSVANGVIGYIYSKLYHIPFVFQYIDIIHELISIQYIRWIARIIIRYLLKHSDYIIVLNKFLKDFVNREIGGKNDISIIPNGISLENTKIDEFTVQRLKTKYNIRDNDRVILFMGRLYDFAGLIEIIDYYNEKITHYGLHLKFLIIGIGKVFHQIKKKIREDNANWVVITGLIPYQNLANYIELADLCLMSFKYNNITKNVTPIKVLEYMAMKKPVLSTKLPGLYNQLGENHGLIYCKDQKNLIMDIEKYISQKEYLKEQGLKAFKYVSRNYLWDILAMKLKKIIFNLIKNPDK